ncbi:MAG TPA: hypothetical protein VEU62_22900 [Bryobacterales bacterium]|nr:hypothetical protein [Bryobacterales bacterium]
MLLLGFVLAVALGAVATLRRLHRVAQEGITAAVEAQILSPTRSALETYQPMGRLFAEGDVRFLNRSRPDLVKRLRRQRQQVLRLYLRELRADFERVYAFCRSLAPRSADPNFAALITQQAFSFYGLFLILHVRCTLGWFLHVRIDTMDLVGAFDRLRQAAQATLAAMTPQPAMAGSPA